jgi:hypothetical protein
MSMGCDGARLSDKRGCVDPGVVNAAVLEACADHRYMADGIDNRVPHQSVADTFIAKEEGLELLVIRLVVEPPQHVVEYLMRGFIRAAEVFCWIVIVECTRQVVFCRSVIHHIHKACHTGQDNEY